MGRLGKWSKYAGVTAFVGMPGGGKSYGLAEMAYRALNRGIRVYSNAGFDIEGSVILESFEDFARVQGPALVVWDELPLYFNSRKWAEFPDGMLYKFTQIRKDGVRLAYSTIHEEMVDVNIRRVTFWYWHCRTTIFPRVLRRTLWPPSQFRRATAKPIDREIVVVRDRVASLYDTYGKVAVQAAVSARIDGLDGDRFVKPGIAVPAGGAVVTPARPTGRAESLGRAGTVPNGETTGDPWGLPIGPDFLLPPDEGFISMDRSSWPRP
jgi:hypothetical protein